MDITSAGQRAARPMAELRRMLIPLALAQFICSFAGSNMNVAINAISKDLGTTVQGVQTAITLFLLTMAALMIPGSKLTDLFGRKRCFQVGLVIYGTGALLGALAQGLPLLIIGYSGFQGIGSALLIPPVYILTTILYPDIKSRARAFGVISGMGGIGAAAGPLLGGLITTAVSWRASFVLQALAVAAIFVLARQIDDPIPADPRRPFDITGAILEALAMVVIVVGILQAQNNLLITLVLLLVGAALIGWFVLHVRAFERRGKEPLLSSTLFRHRRTSNLGLVTQNIQWLLLLGISFTVSVYLQVVRGYNAIQTGLIFTAATAGILFSSALAERWAQRYAQRTLVVTGFAVTLGGIVLLLALVSVWSSVLAFLPGLLFIGLGVGGMLTPSVNVVQSSFPEALQGEISGVSRSVSNLGSSLGTAIAGTILVADLAQGDRAYALAILALAAAGLIGLCAGLLLPSKLVVAERSAV